MKCKYVTYLIISIGMNLFFWYYIMAFCAVYVTTSVGWLYSAMLEIIITFLVIQILDPLTKSICRSIVTKDNRYKSLMDGQIYLCMIVEIVLGG
jgi:hypothetical protein